MQITITTRVGQDYQTVFGQFNRELFLALKPPLIPMQLLRFDGCKTGDEVHLQLGLGQEWISVITRSGNTGNAIFFVDEGKKLPFFLNYWQHEHIIAAAPDNHNECLITDNISFRSYNKLLTLLLYPLLYVQFAWRIPVYRSIFGKTGRPLK